MIKGFRDELDSLVRDKVDPTRSLPGYIQYRVRSQTDPALEEAAEICPTRAIVKDGHDQWMIDDRLCVLCNACKEIAPDAIAIVDRFRPVDFPVAVAAAGGGA
jgi:ferredoxin